MRKVAALLALLLLNLRSLEAQGTFRNLNFESAQVVFVDPPFDEAIATTNALPGWSALSGTNSLAVINYRLGGASVPVALVSQTNLGSITPLSGNDSVLLSFSSSMPQPSNTLGSISQTGLVPVGSQSLLFEVGGGIVSNSPLAVSLGGQDLSYIAISNALNYTLYGADISSFAGQTETLSFTATLKVGYPGAELDNIQFSPEAIPEPSPASLLCLGSGVLIYVRRRWWFRL